MTYERALPKSRPVFISCSTKDIGTARFIRSAINQLPTFYGYIARDERAQFAYPSEKIASMLEMCSAFIILYTKKAIKSPMVNQELGFFFHRWRRNPQVSPILLVKSTEIKDEIEGFAYGRAYIV